MKTIILYLILIVFVSSCSTEASLNGIENKETSDLSLINISLYRADSHRVQPELIIAESDPTKINSALKWAQTGNYINIPSVKDINRIYILQFQYSTDTSTENMYYMYVTDKNKNQFLKQINSNQITDLDIYNPSVIDLILMKVGLDEWQNVSPSSLLLGSKEKN